MTPLSDVDLAALVAASANMLGLQLDGQALEAVRDAMRGVVSEAEVVLDYPEMPAAA